MERADPHGPGGQLLESLPCSDWLLKFKHVSHIMNHNTTPNVHTSIEPGKRLASAKLGCLCGFELLLLLPIYIDILLQGLRVTDDLVAEAAYQDAPGHFLQLLLSNRLRDYSQHCDTVLVLRELFLFISGGSGCCDGFIGIKSGCRSSRGNGKQLRDDIAQWAWISGEKTGSPSVRGHLL